MLFDKKAGFSPGKQPSGVRVLLKSSSRGPVHRERSQIRLGQLKTRFAASANVACLDCCSGSASQTKLPVSHSAERTTDVLNSSVAMTMHRETNDVNLFTVLIFGPASRNETSLNSLQAQPTESAEAEK